jgi:hypothetical protein
LIHLITDYTGITTPRLPPDPRVVADFGEPLVGGIRNQTMRPQKFRSGIKVYVEIQKRIPYLKIKVSDD